MGQLSATYRRRNPEQSHILQAVRPWMASVPNLLSEYLGEHVQLPPFIRKAVQRYLDCGQLCKGFLRARCTGCGEDRLVAFSCKVRGLCTSCDGRRMAEAAAHQVDNVLPEIGYRQWVLTYPFLLRYRLAWDQSLRAAVLTIFTRELQKFYLRKLGLTDAKAGGISVLHRFDSAIKIDPHHHILFGDGVWTGQGEQKPQFHELFKLEPDDVPAVLEAIVARTHRLLGRRKLLYLLVDVYDEDSNEPPSDEFAAEEPALAAALKASLYDQTLWGPEKKPRREKGAAAGVVHLRSRNCADLCQFSLHANTRIGACNRIGLEKMIRYLCRPAISGERVELLDGGNTVRLKLKTPWRDGTTWLRLSGPDFVLRMVALVPAPKRALLHYHGVFAPACRWRRAIVLHTARPRTPALPKADLPPAECDHATKPATDRATPDRMSWAEIHKRMFLWDVLACDKCGGRRKIIATIPHGPIAEKILTHLKLPLTAEGFAPIRAPPWEDFGWAYASNFAGDEPFGPPPDDDWPMDAADPSYDDADAAA